MYLPRLARLLLLAGLALAFGGCGPPELPEPSARSVNLNETALIEPVSAVIIVREKIQLASLGRVPPPVSAADPVPADAYTACTVRLITRWEVSGERAYTRKYQGVIWPGGASGPTWGIGYDGGHQTRLDIARDWADHGNVRDLVSTSAVLGQAAKMRLKEWGHVRTPYPYAADVFAQASLPAYESAARRALGPGFVSLPSGARCGLVSMGYNRGWSMTGPRQREKRAIRDRCIAELGGDVDCIAEQIRASKRLWPDVAGLRDRRDDEARTVLILDAPQAQPTPGPTPSTAPTPFRRLPGKGPSTTLAAN